MGISRDHEHRGNLVWCLRGAPRTPTFEQLASTHDSQHARLLVEMVLCTEGLNEAQGAHDRDVAGVSELGRIAIFSAGCSCVMGGSRWSVESVGEPLIGVSEQVEGARSG